MDTLQIIYWLVILSAFAGWGYFLFSTEFENAKRLFICGKEWRPTSDVYCGKLYGHIKDEGTKHIIPSPTAPSTTAASEKS
jgi:hypothetical protein